MVEFIATRIEESADLSVEKGQTKYNAYFKIKRYKKYKEDVDSILTLDGYENIILDI